ncbi:MAG: hypothetical protein NTV84_02530 [Methanoregula sp.]|nr:hypothetical protein [Methanoregula sp.]
MDVPYQISVGIQELRAQNPRQGLVTGSSMHSGRSPLKTRYCKVKYRVNYPKPAAESEDEKEFLERRSREDFTRDEVIDTIKDFAEIALLKVDHASPGVIKEKQKALESTIAFAKMHR